MADALEKSNSYVRHHRRADGTQLGMVFLVEAALGTMAEITRDDGSLVKAPNGFHSVLAKGTVAPDMYDSLKNSLLGQSRSYVSYSPAYSEHC